MKRVEDVLGKGWELYAEGQKLQSESSAFRKKLDTRPVFDAWLHDINRRDMGVGGRLFEIVRLSRGGGFQPEFAVGGLPGSACDYEYGEGCEEGLPACC
jgi:dynein heavy chain 1